ncbi:uncharacterized protein YukE [Frigoribacterium sp. PvP054]|uniref:hypothetical protein n=1 Tax=Frigoribacterium sp. PvP054 TaxID=3156438 RepID=UPI00339B5931
MSLDDDPGLGSVDGIRRLAASRRDEVDDLEVASYRLTEAASWGAECWHGRSGERFVAAVTDVATEAAAVARGLEHHAAALEAYAAQVALIQGTKQTLEARRAMAEKTIMSTGATLKAIVHEAAEAARGDLFGLVVEAEYRSGERTTLQRRIDDERQELETVASLWADLVEERAAADRRCIAALQSPEAMGALPQVTAAALATGPAGALLDLLAGLSATELTMLLEQHPELVDEAFLAAPGRVRAWWDALGEQGSRNTDGLTALQLALVRGAPAIIGALDGLPPSVRIAANAINAARRIAEIDRMVGPLRRRGLTGDAELLAALARERAYLKGAVAQPPAVQLYLYDAPRSRIIEMLGTWDAATVDHVITYVPGTYSSLHGFYRHSIQEMPQWLQRQGGSGVVAFVYKDGPFPGEEALNGEADLTRIGEANDPRRARDAGRQLASFQAGLRADAVFAGETPARTTAIGHSWGLTNITSSELYATHYDSVVSLSGAGMLNEWRPDASTVYRDYSYRDILQQAQDLHVVWNGKNPRKDDSFVHNDYYGGVEDVLVRDSAGRLIMPDFGTLFDNHNLVARATDANNDVREDLKQDLLR